MWEASHCFHNYKFKLLIILAAPKRFVAAFSLCSYFPAQSTKQHVRYDESWRKRII